MIKKLFGITAVTLIANAGLACPDLAGTYQCSEDGETYTEVVTQRVENGVTMYSFKSEGENAGETIADGKSREVDLGDGEMGIYVATCKADKLLREVKMGEDGDWVLKYEIEKVGRFLHTNMSLFVDGESWGKESQFCEGT